MIAIISDVHGNYPALMAVLKAIDSIGCDRIISLGDVAGYYCMINECIEEFRRRNIVNLMGNHDFYLSGSGRCSRSQTVNQCIEYQKKAILEINLKYLEKCPMRYDDEIISARHGGWIDPIEEYINKFDFSIPKDDRIYCSGHTHIQGLQKSGEMIYFNPGAVGQPRDGDARAAFAIIDNGEVNLYRVEYPIKDIALRMKKEGFEDRLTDCLYKGIKIQTFVSKTISD